MDIEEQIFDLMRNGNLQSIQEFYNNNPNINNSSNDEYAFGSACSYGLLEVAKWLLEVKPNIDISANDERAFCSACGEGHLEVAKWLLQVKPDIDISADNEYVFCCVCAHGHLDVAKWLLEIKPDIIIYNIAFFNACRYKNNDIALWLSTIDQRFVVVIQNDVILDYYVSKLP